MKPILKRRSGLVFFEGIIATGVLSSILLLSTHSVQVSKADGEKVAVSQISKYLDPINSAVAKKVAANPSLVGKPVSLTAVCSEAGISPDVVTNAIPDGYTLHFRNVYPPARKPFCTVSREDDLPDF